ncbi:hypothetical protein AVEN_150431-1 [Araneus ventricosus]|uniref:Uncharacterized protein n=1 Tax=Araneus ventricosus TaxID=182803 RepID=A0A4Y2RDL9_ARAVE|nr:hypothetical protein AVEN_150431-1 [Araneus ventricosus]
MALGPDLSFSLGHCLPPFFHLVLGNPAQSFREELGQVTSDVSLDLTSVSLYIAFTSSSSILSLAATLLRVFLAVGLYLLRRVNGQ